MDEQRQNLFPLISVFEYPLASACLAFHHWIDNFEVARVSGQSDADFCARFSLPHTLVTQMIFYITIPRDEAPVREFVLSGEQADLGVLPIVRHFEMDLAPVLTMATIMKDPDEGFYDVTAENEDGLPDGMKVDSQGNLYVAGNTYVRLTGRRAPGEAQMRADGAEADRLADEALEGLMRRIAKFENPDTPYVSWAAPQFMGAFGGDYDHLARVREWAVQAAAGEEGGE